MEDLREVGWWRVLVVGGLWGRRERRSLDIYV